MSGIFETWDETHSQLWERQPICLNHTMHQSPLFSMDELARLIENYPREHYSLVQTGSRESRRMWREGSAGDLNGRQIIDAIAAGQLWLNLRQVSRIDRRYHDLLDSMFGEISRNVPDFKVRSYESGILISSPDAQVYYHADIPGQGLIQIAGRKRVYLYPVTAPFITRQQIEDITLFDVEVDMPYAPWYDAHAKVFDLEPGQMLSWPLNAPHRVENLNTLNISMTVSYRSEQIRRNEIVNLANGILRHRFKYTPRSSATSGVPFYTKAVLQKALRNSSWVKRERSARRTIDFRLDPSQPGLIVDLPQSN